MASLARARSRVSAATAAAAKAAAAPESKPTSEPAAAPQIAPVSQPAAAPAAPAALPPAVTAPVVAETPQAMPPQTGAPANSALFGLQAVPGTGAVANAALAGASAAAGLLSGGMNTFVGISRREEELEKENLGLKAKVAELEMAVKAAEAKRDEHERKSVQMGQMGRTSQEEFQQLQRKNSKLEEENMILHNGAAELQMLKLEMAEMENLHQATEQAIQRQLSVLTVEKMKLAHKVGGLEAENAEQRQQWLNYHKQWSRNTMHG